MELNREKGAPPLYIQLEELIRSEIEGGVYVKGDILPSEKQYMDMFHISRVTARTAFSALEQDGYIRRSRGIGTQVICEKISEKMSRVISFTEEMKKHGIEMHTSFCEIELLVPDMKTIITLGLRNNESCYRLTRVREVEGKPLVYTVTYLKNTVSLPLEPCFYTSSLYQFLRDKYGLSIVRGTDVLEAALPSEKVQELLHISKDTPIFIRTRKAYMASGELFEYSICYYPGNRYKYSVDL